MKVKYIGNYYSRITFDKEKEYKVLDASDDFFQIIDESGEACWFPSDEFEVISA